MSVISTNIKGTLRCNFSSEGQIKGRVTEGGGVAPAPSDFDIYMMKKSEFPQEGKEKAFYVDTEENMLYRWNGEAYVTLANYTEIDANV